MIHHWHWSMPIGIVMVVGVICHLRKKHVKARAFERLCTHKLPSGSLCKEETIRHYKMVRPSHSRDRKIRRWSILYTSVIIDECPDNGHFKLISRINKEFSLISLVWRHVTDPRQFDEDQELFKKAGLIREIHPSLGARIAEMAHEEEIKIRKPAFHFITPKPVDPPVLGLKFRKYC